MYDRLLDDAGVREERGAGGCDGGDEHQAQLRGECHDRGCNGDEGHGADQPMDQPGQLPLCTFELHVVRGDVSASAALVADIVAETLVGSQV